MVHWWIRNDTQVVPYEGIGNFLRQDKIRFSYVDVIDAIGALMKDIPAIV